MSKYNSYATWLNDLFHETSAKYSELAKAVETAEREAQQYTERHPGTVYEAKQLAAQAALTAAKEEFRVGVRELFDRYERGVNSLTAELESTLQSDRVVNSADVDGNALELLKSGIMTAADYAAMLEQFSGNPTMSRMIHKYAEERRKDIADPAERQQMTVIAMRAAENGGGKLHAWNDLVTASKLYSGANNPMRAKYVQDMQKYWDKPDIQAELENF